MQSFWDKIASLYIVSEKINSGVNNRICMDVALETAGMDRVLDCAAGWGSPTANS